MADKNWKQVERKLAAVFGTQRTALSGSNSKITKSDSLHGELFIEVKYRQRHAVHQLFDQTAAFAKEENKIPLVALKQARTQGFLVVCRLEDIKRIAELIK